MEKKLSPCAICLLVVIDELATRGKIANMGGLIKIVQGVVDSETEGFTDMIGFSSAISLKGKRAKNLLHSLVHQGYLDQRYIEGDYFLALRDSGRIIALENKNKVAQKSFKEPKPKRVTIRDI